MGFPFDRGRRSGCWWSSSRLSSFCFLVPLCHGALPVAGWVWRYWISSILPSIPTRFQILTTWTFCSILASATHRDAILFTQQSIRLLEQYQIEGSNGEKQYCRCCHCTVLLLFYDLSCTHIEYTVRTSMFVLMTDYTYTVIQLLSHLDLCRQYYWRTEWRITVDILSSVCISDKSISSLFLKHILYWP